MSRLRGAWAVPWLMLELLELDEQSSKRCAATLGKEYGGFERLCAERPNLGRLVVVRSGG